MKNKSASIKKSNLLNAIIVYLIVGLIGIIMIYPFLYAFFGSIVSTRDFYNSTFLPWAIQDGFTFVNYQAAADTALIRPFFVTLARCAWYIFFNIFTTVTCAYCFAFFRFKGNGAAFAIIMSSMLLPSVALMMSTYVFFARFPLVGGNNILGQGGTGFIDHPAILFIPGLFSAYNIFLFRQALTSLGTEIKEAAEVDGAGILHIMFGIYRPLLRALVAVIIVNVFIGQWNDYMGPLMYIGKNTAWHPIGLAAVNVMGRYVDSALAGSEQVDYPVSYAIAVCMLTPPIICFFVAQKQFIAGLSMGSLKG